MFSKILGQYYWQFLLDPSLMDADDEVHAILSVQIFSQKP